MKTPYKHRLLLLFNEFPALGKLGIFEQAIAYFGGWNIKAYLICQDKAQLDAAYAKDESITLNCHVTVAYAPNKVETAKISFWPIRSNDGNQGTGEHIISGRNRNFRKEKRNEISARSPVSSFNAR